MIIYAKMVTLVSILPVYRWKRLLTLLVKQNNQLSFQNLNRTHAQMNVLDGTLQLTNETSLPCLLLFNPRNVALRTYSTQSPQLSR